MEKYKMLGRYIKRISLLVASMSLLVAIAPLAIVQAGSPGEINSWITSPNTLPQATKQGSLATANGYVYELGGVNGGGGTNAVYYAPLNNDGSVGSWVTSSNTLPQNIDQATAVAYNGFIYLIGGYNGGIRLNTIYYAPLNANGSVGSWTAALNTLPQHIDDLSSTTANGYVYVMGGIGNSGTVNTVYYAPLNPNGSVGSWVTSSNSLPQVSSYGAAVTSNGYIYLLGIYNGATQLTNIDYAPLNINGSVGSWTTATNPLLQAVDEPGSVILDGYIYVMGGNGGGASVSFAPLNSNGDIGTWTLSSSSLPVSLFFGGAVTYNGHIYVIGGQSGGTPQNGVYYTALSDPPVVSAPTSPTISSSSDPGTPATPDTGYSVPVQPSIVNKAMLAGIILMGVSLVLIYRHKHAKARS
jgi:N-acetylneuraminic acid mutarotase